MDIIFLNDDIVESTIEKEVPSVLYKFEDPLDPEENFSLDVDSSEIGNYGHISGNSYSDYSFDVEEFLKQIYLYEIRFGVPVGKSEPLFKNSSVPGVKVISRSGRVYNAAFLKLNFLSRKTDGSPMYGGVDESLLLDSEKEKQFLLDVENFLRKYGDQQKKVLKDNDRDVNAKFFFTPIEENNSLSSVYLDFFGDRV